MSSDKTYSRATTPADAHSLITAADRVHQDEYFHRSLPERPLDAIPPVGRLAPDQGQRRSGADS